MAQVNLLQITGDAIVTEAYDCEGRCNISLHLEVYNPSATATVTVVDHRRYYLTPGGWVDASGGPWGSSDFYGMGPTIPPATRRTFTTSTPWDVGLSSHLLLDVKLSAGTDTDNVLVQIPITIPPGVSWTQFAAGVVRPPAPPSRPDPLPFVYHRYPIFMQEPVDVLPVMDGTKAWLVLTGQLANPWRDSFTLGGFSYILEDDAGNRKIGSLPLQFRTDQADAAGNLVWVDFTTQSSSAGMFSFNHAIVVDPATIPNWSWITLTLDRIMPGATYTRRIPISQDTRTPRRLRYPLGTMSNVEWSAWNAPALDGFTSHNGDQSERYALDIVAYKNGTTLVNPSGSDSDNTNFLAYGRPVLAMDDGIVVFVRKSVPDGLGKKGYKLPPPGGGAWPSNIPAGGNVVVLQHQNQRYSVYCHLIPESSTNTYPAPGSSLTAGQQLGFLGNSGNTSEPHLHVAYWTFDRATGFHRALPMAFSNITTSTGTALTGVIVGDNRVKV